MTNLIEFSCSHCGHLIRTNARYAGKKGTCPKCGQSVTVDAPVEEDFQPDPEPAGTAPTEANTLVAGAIGAAATALLYMIFLFVLRNTYIGRLFVERGPIPFVATFVTCWGFAILGLKHLAVKQQLSYAELELELLPLKAGVQISPRNVDTFLQNLDSLPEDARTSILGARIHGALEHFRSRQSVPEVQAYLSSRADIDTSSVDSGYTLLRAFIWCVPILGFIGTVMGISAAVNDLSDTLTTQPNVEAEAAAADDVSPPDASATTAVGAGINRAMEKVTQGLSVAFDTTFLALIMAILLLFPTEWLKRVEIGMLDRIESFTNDSLLRRMSDESRTQIPPEIAKVLEPAFREHQQWLVAWESRVSDLGNVIGQDFAAHVGQFQDRLERLENARSHEVEKLVQSFQDSVKGAADCIERLTGANSELNRDFESTMTATAALQTELGRNTETMAQLADKWRTVSSASDNGSNTEALQESFTQLNVNVSRLADLLNAGPADPAATDGHARRGLLGLFGKK